MERPWNADRNNASLKHALAEPGPNQPFVLCSTGVQLTRLPSTVGLLLQRLLMQWTFLEHRYFSQVNTHCINSASLN